jgi:m7GpppX diphosphatase
MPLTSLAGLRVTEVLAVDPEAKTAAVAGTFPSSATPTAVAVVRFARAPFDPDRVAAAFAGGEEEGEEGKSVLLTPIVENDVYSKYRGALPSAADAAIIVDVIYPATDKHVAKYRATKARTRVETAVEYARVHAPYIEALPLSRTAWVDNILDGTAEADRVLLSTRDCVLVADLKWDPKAGGEGLYAVALLRDPALRSLRDIDAATAPRLAAAVADCRAALADACGVAPADVRAFVHYPPSYYRFHVHFAAHGAPADDACGRARAVDDVLGAVAVCPSFWRDVDLTITLLDGSDLARAFGE